MVALPSSTYDPESSTDDLDALDNTEVIQLQDEMPDLLTAPGAPVEKARCFPSSGHGMLIE